MKWCKVYSVVYQKEYLLQWFYIFLLIFSTSDKTAKCSEFPERECCDPIYPPEPEPIPPALPTTTIASSSPSLTSILSSSPSPSLGRSGILKLTIYVILMSFCWCRKKEAT